MQLIRKTIIKEDGRTVYVYHFPETATEEQRSAFEQIVVEEDGIV